MNRVRGFTLIELMTVVAVVAILASIALPAFNDQVRRSHRSEAVTGLQGWHLRFEQWRANNPSYANADPSNPSYPGLAVPAIPNYVVSLVTATPTKLEMKATAQGGQEKDKARGTSCKDLIIAIDAGAINKTPVECWR